MSPDYLKYFTIIIVPKHLRKDVNNLGYIGVKCYHTHVLDVSMNSTRNKVIKDTISRVLHTPVSNTPFLYYLKESITKYLLMVWNNQENQCRYRTS